MLETVQSQAYDPMMLYTRILYWTLKLYTLLKIVYVIYSAWYKGLCEKKLYKTNMIGNQLNYYNDFR